MADDRKIIFSMVGVGQKPIHPTKSAEQYFPVVFLWGKNWRNCLNGSGKSTLLRIHSRKRKIV